MKNKIQSVLFVCLGNICRSPMCESITAYLLKKNRLDNIKVDSMGTSMEEYGNPVHSGTKRALYEHGIPCIPHTATQIRKSDYDKYDLIIGLDQSNVRNLYRIFGGDKDDKIFLLMTFVSENRDVADPWWTGDFEKTFEDCYRGCSALVEYIKSRS